MFYLIKLNSDPPSKVADQSTQVYIKGFNQAPSDILFQIENDELSTEN